MGHNYKSWWTGSDLSIEESRKLVPGINATIIQVAAGVIAAVTWMVQHPNEGVCLPDDLPHEHVLAVAKPYLGKWISHAYDWTPLTKKQVLFPDIHNHPHDEKIDNNNTNNTIRNSNNSNANAPQLQTANASEGAKEEADAWQFESFRYYL